MKSPVCITISFLVLAVLLESESVTAAEGYKGTWLDCDKTGIGFDIDKDMIAKAIGCATPHLMDIAGIKDWSPEGIDKSKPELITKLVHCLIKKLNFIDDKTGKVKANAAKDISVALKQDNVRKQFLAIANDCYKKNEKSMTKEPKSFKPYIRCFEYSKLSSVCPNTSAIKPGNKFDVKGLQMLG